ncbi:MAG: hypothetical protein ACK55I_26045 [bacterium]
MLRAEPEPVRVLIRGALHPKSTAAPRPASWPCRAGFMVVPRLSAAASGRSGHRARGAPGG